MSHQAAKFKQIPEEEGKAESTQQLLMKKIVHIGQPFIESTGKSQKKNRREGTEMLKLPLNQLQMKQTYELGRNLKDKAIAQSSLYSTNSPEQIKSCADLLDHAVQNNLKEIELLNTLRQISNKRGENAPRESYDTNGIKVFPEKTLERHIKLDEYLRLKLKKKTQKKRQEQLSRKALVKEVVSVTGKKYSFSTRNAGF